MIVISLLRPALAMFWLLIDRTGPIIDWAIHEEALLFALYKMEKYNKKRLVR